MENSKIGSIHGIHCAGCRYSFESYEMEANEGYVQDGKIYCSSECQMESESAALEASEWNALSEEY